MSALRKSIFARISPRSRRSSLFPANLDGGVLKRNSDGLARKRPIAKRASGSKEDPAIRKESATPTRPPMFEPHGGSVNRRKILFVNPLSGVGEMERGRAERRRGDVGGAARAKFKRIHFFTKFKFLAMCVGVGRVGDFGLTSRESDNSPPPRRAAGFDF